MASQNLSRADITRLNILNKAFALIYRSGYQATSIDDIIATTQVTKGALYYHFKNKDEMGLAIIEEVMYPAMHSTMIKPLTEATHPQKEIYKMMKGILENESFFDVRYGCPAVNLIEEMAPLNSAFAKALKKLFTEWKNAIIHCVEEGKKKKIVNTDVNSEQVAILVLSGYSGIRNLGKLVGKSCYTIYLKELKNYLNTVG
ncbi:MAG: TetR/AcrR family transcriptional regulator [Bacteroidota bacterium]